MPKVYPECEILPNEPLRATCISAWELKPEWAKLVDHFIVTAHYDLKESSFHRHAYGILANGKVLHFTCCFKDNPESFLIEGLVIKPFLGKFCYLSEEDTEDYLWGWPDGSYWKKNKWIKKRNQGWRTLRYKSVKDIPPREEFFKEVLGDPK